MSNATSLAPNSRRSLVHRLTRTFLFWMAAAYVFSLAGLWLAAHYIVETNLNKELLRLSAELDEMGTPLFFADGKPALERVRRYARLNSDILYVRYYHAGNRQVLGEYVKAEHAAPAALDTQIASRVDATEVGQLLRLSEHRLGAIASLRGIAPIRSRSLRGEQMLDMDSLNDRGQEDVRTIGYLDIGIDISPSRKAIMTAMGVAAGVSSLLLLLALVFCRRHVRRSLASLLRLQEPLQQLANGNFNVVVEHSARDPEIARVCEALNRTIEALRLRNAEIEDAMRAKLQAESASEAKNLFLAHMSHEIRTPLNGIMGFLKLLSKTTLTPTQREYLHTTEVSAKTLLTVINDILDFSKIEAGKISMEQLEIEFRELLEEVMALYAANAEEKCIDLVFVYSQAVPKRLMGDPARISQVLSNLVGNAIKFTQQGEVVVTVELRAETKTDVWVELAVKDTGIGIPDEAKTRLFQPFAQADASTTRKYGGTGLGLIICKRLVEMMGGDIVVESQAGAGTCFKVTLHLAKQSSADLAMPIDELLASERVLTVTPNAMVARSLMESLASWGIESDTAGSGEAALRMLAQSMRKKPFGAVILDQGIRDMTPQEFARQSTGAVGATTPLLLLGGFSGSLRREEAQQNGFAAVINKPAKSSELFNELTRLFLGSRAVAAERVSGSAEESVRLERDGKPARVLIVDDNEINRKLAKIMVDQLGGEADFAEDGTQAVQACQRQRYDLVLMDVHMPVMDGLEATARIRDMEGNARHTLIVALTANAMSGDRERYLAAGMDDYLGKPISEKAFLGVMQKCGLLGKGAVPARPSPAPPATGADNASLPALDPELGVQLAFGDRDTWRSMLEILYGQLPGDGERLREEKAALNLEQLRQIAHRIAGAASYCGTPALHRDAKLLENLIKGGEVEAAMQAVDELLRQIDRLLALKQDGKLPDGAEPLY